MNVLVVEDDVILGDVTKELLQIRGHEPTLARTVDEALGLLSVQNAFAVILLDLQLGAERGETIILKLMAGNHQVPTTLLLSAQPIAELQDAARQVGAAGILQKPCSIQKLLKAIEGIASTT
jgi:DNA-binding response OmpR family regulator